MPAADLLPALGETLRAQCPPGKRWLAAVSGGVDSVALLHLLAHSGYQNVVVLHLDHRLRGRTSTADARFVSRLAAELGYPCESARAEVKSLAAQRGIALEQAGREARHAFFADCARKHRCPRILLAHHAGDQAETILMNLIRGAAGLRGMAAITEMHVPGRKTPLTLCRPLLTIAKATLLTLAESQRWPHREDASNTSSDYRRNRVRHELLPLLADIFQRDPAPALLRAANLSADAESYLSAAAAAFLATSGPAPAAEIPARTLAAEPPALQRRVLHLWLHAHRVPDLSLATVERTRTLLDLATGPPAVSLPGKRLARRTSARLRIENAPPSLASCQPPRGSLTNKQ